MRPFFRNKTKTLLTVAFILLLGPTVSAVTFTSRVEGQQSTPKMPDSTVIRVESSRLNTLKQSVSQAGLNVTKTLTLPGDESLITIDASLDTVNLAIGFSPTAPLTLQTVEQLDAFPNYTYELTATPNDPKYQNGDQWNLDKINMPEAWDITTGSSDTTIAVVDSGVLFNQQPYHNHSDMNDARRWENEDETLNGNDSDGNGYVDDKYGWDFMGGFVGDSNCPNNSDAGPGDTSSTYISEDNDPQPYSCDNGNDPTLLNKNHSSNTFSCGLDNPCALSHGTLAGSTAAAASNNTTLAAGIDWSADIMNLRIFNAYGRSDSAGILAAITYAAHNGADVVNLSLSMNENGSCDITDSFVESILQHARNHGVVVVASSGNDSQDHVCYPASSDHTIAVGASDQNDERADFSNYGDTLDLVAPGYSVPALVAPSAYNGGDEYTDDSSGTSLAAPHVSGVAALLKNILPSITLKQTQAALRNGADTVSQMDGQNETKQYGTGRLNTHKTLEYANIPHPDGVLVKRKGEPHIYLIENGQKRYIPNPATLNSHNYRWRSIKPATLATANLPSGDSLPLREGTLVTAKNDAKIYIIDHQGGTTQKRHIGSPDVFNQLGFQWKRIMEVRSSTLPSDNGPAVTSTTTHPDGVLIRPESSPHIYLVQDNQRRYVKSPAVLKSHRFRNGVKQAAENDMDLTKGSTLDFREGTLVKDGDPPIYMVNHASDGAVEKRHVKTLFAHRLLELGSSKTFGVSSSALPDQNGTAIK